MKVFIEHWDAVELFCYLVCKIEECDISKFHDNEQLLKAMTKYGKINEAREASFRLLKNRTTLEKMVRMIRYKEPVVLSRKEYDAIMRSISSKAKKIVIPVQDLNVVWAPRQKATLFTGRWSVYYYEEIGRVPSVVKAVMTLKPFNKAVIESLSADSGKKEVYTGKYFMYGTDAKYMRLAMKIDGTMEKDLQMFFYIGSNVPEIAMGDYHNVDGTIYCGTAIMQKSLGKGRMTTKFYPFAQRSEDIPEYIWQYFEDKHLNRIRIPSQINTVEKLENWQEKQRIKRKK